MIPEEFEEGRRGEWWSRVDANRGPLGKLHPECGKSLKGNSTLGNSFKFYLTLAVYTGSDSSSLTIDTTTVWLRSRPVMAALL